jgi:hypothetical protein
MLCRRRGRGANAQGSGGREGPRHAGGDARKKHAHGQSRRFRYLKVAPDVSVQRLAHGPLHRFGRFRIQDRRN